VAQLVLAAGTSHTPQLSIHPDQWDVFRERDREINPLYARNGDRMTFTEAVSRRRQAGFVLDEDGYLERHERCQRLLENLSRDLAAARLDVVVVVGDDQEEALSDDNLPPFLVYGADGIVGRGLDSDEKRQRRARSSMRELAEWSYSPKVDVDYPGHRDLAIHLTEYLIHSGFDPSFAGSAPNGRSVGHAFGFVYQRLFAGEPPRSIPVMVNTYYPPNQPTPARCVAFGQALQSAIGAYPEDLRVGVIASGGLTHHFINEELDNEVVNALLSGDVSALGKLEPHELKGGTSEVRNWIIMAACATDLLRCSWLEYLPCYRSEAGSGCAMAFGLWLAS